MSDIAALAGRLREVKTTDHDRGCQGREYTCSCGWDGRIWAAAIEAADALEALQAAMISERERCYHHATAPDYGELTPEARAEADRIATRIKDGSR